MSVDPALALAFLNTSEPAGGGPDLWSSPDDVWRWLRDAGLASERHGPARLTPPESRLLRVAALRLRCALRELVEGWTTPGAAPPGMALLELNRVLEARPGRSLALDVGPRGYEIRDRTAPASVAGFLARVAEAGAHLLAHGDPATVRRCAAPACGLWFLDTSRNQRRRWCSMAVCGNRAKVAAHHRRTRGRRGR